ncbi:hypothetical protein [Peptostreptococcus porci]|uniref:hypothetical protein n=1 Tax=Peptostreptococcus porci TaxID=2652282 RepID=UPI002A80706A|nr:hypothetical protein [Peptostreptococcus porci]MDY4127676.1 hypothetical protein [Peptostreptococcus porci]
MTDKQLELFKEFCYSYSQRFKFCFCANTGDGYPQVFAKNHFIRCLDYFEDKYHIEIKPTNEKAYNIYESIMIEEINKFIDEYKKIQSEKDKKAAKNKNVKRKKD